METKSLNTVKTSKEDSLEVFFNRTNLNIQKKKKDIVYEVEMQVYSHDQIEALQKSIEAAYKKLEALYALKRKVSQKEGRLKRLIRSFTK